MPLKDITKQGVLAAIREFNTLGRENFLNQYSFGSAKEYWLIDDDGQRYDSKAIVGVAHKFSRPDLGLLKSSDFSGGMNTVKPTLEKLGFTVLVNGPERDKQNLPDKTTMKKYEPLGKFLADLNHWEIQISLTFDQVETIIGAKLPNSAFHFRPWWANQQASSQATHWHEAGFKVKTVNLEQKFVTFCRLSGSSNDANGTSWLEKPSIKEITNAIENIASGFSFGNLQSIRQQLKGLERCSRTIFKEKTIFDNFAFHYGGREELQFNIGFDDDENQQLRHGLAISLRSGPSIAQIDGSILRRFARLNDFIECHAEEFSDFLMYESRYDSDEWSGYHEVRPVSPEIVELNAFIFIGKFQDPQYVSIEQILYDFDRLLPMYEFVEYDGISPHKKRYIDSGFKPGLTKKPSRTTASMTERRLNKSLRHNDIQFALGQILIQRHGIDKVGDEFITANGKRVDLVVKDGNEMIFYEIKVCESAQHCIRQAIGQLLEYSYWPNVSRATKLVVVGEAELDQEAQEYLSTLHKEFRLPIDYEQFEWESNTLR